MPSDVKAVAAKNGQRQSAKRATLEMLQSKRARSKEFEVVLTPGEDPVSFEFRALGSMAYDEMLSKHPPTPQQLASNAQFNINTFAPALLAAVCRDPEMSPSQWKEIWTSPEWNRGEVTALFWTAVDLCNEGVDLTPIGAG